MLTLIVIVHSWITSTVFRLRRLVNDRGQTTAEYALVLGFNLPHGVHWSAERRQHVADRPADTRRSGGIFLHVQGSRNTAGCVAAPLRDVRWLVRHLDPAHAPRIAMGPTSWVKRAL